MLAESLFLVGLSSPTPVSVAVEAMKVLSARWMECPGFPRDLQQPGSYLRWKNSLGNRPPERGWQDLCVFLGILVEGYPQGCCAPHASAPVLPANGKPHGLLTRNPAVSFTAEVAKICWLRGNIHFSMACVGFGCFFFLCSKLLC